MTKQNVLMENAERLYVLEQMSINTVAEKVGVNERTIRRWKTDNKWDFKRKQYIKTKSMCHEELYNLARKLMASIEFDLDNGEKIDQSRLYAFTKMLPLITKIKNYEDTVSQKEKEAESKGITPDFVQLIEEEILGIRHREE